MFRAAAAIAAALLTSSTTDAASIKGATNKHAHSGPHVDSRLSSGESSFISFPDELDKHVENLELRRSGKGSHVTPDSTLVESSKNSFLDTYASQFGVKKEHLRRSHAHEEAGSGLTYHHYEQWAMGHKVFGGEVVVITGSHGQVVEGHGHPLQVSDILDFYADAPYSSDLEAVKSAVISKVSEVTQSSSVDVIHCDEDAWSLETSWYRGDLLSRGRTGEVSLVVHASGKCSVREGSASSERKQGVVFDAFGMYICILFAKSCDVM